MIAYSELELEEILLEESNNYPRVFEANLNWLDVLSILWMIFCLDRTKGNFCLKNCDHYVVYMLSFCELQRWFLQKIEYQIFLFVNLWIEV